MIFYITGRITAYIKQHTQWSTCLNAFLTTSEIHADTIFFSCDQLPESLSRFAKINKDYKRPNVKLYKLITVVEYLFNKPFVVKKSSQALRHLTSHHRSVHVKNFKCVKNMY